MNRTATFAVMLTLFAGVLTAQQMNGVQAALSVNGTGRVDAMGNVIPTNSQLSPPPATSAPPHFAIRDQGIGGKPPRASGDVPSVAHADSNAATASSTDRSPVFTA